MCEYRGYDFGAHYMDSACIDGYLCDMDAVDDGAGVSDIPCPQCNHREWMEWWQDEIETAGYVAFCDGIPPIPPYMPTHRMRYPDDAYHMRSWWLDGYREARYNDEPQMCTGRTP